MSKAKTISVVPWYKPEQFHRVHKAIFSNDVTKIRWALDQISVWETRCHPGLPTGVEATLVLTRAIIQDILHRNITTVCHDSDIRSLYCLAFIRFVNLTLELKQNAKQKLPLTVVAKTEGLPYWMIDLRNQASHSHCPSLPVLRAGADHAMRYLKRTFWEVEESRIQSYVKDVKDEEDEVHDLISSYKEYKYKELKEEIECTEEIKKVVDGMRRYLKSNRMRFVELLTHEGMFVFTEEELVCILTGIDDDYLKYRKKVELPEVLEYFWDKVLNLIVRYDLTGDFAELLLLSQESREPLSKKLAISWVFNIIKSARLEYNKQSDYSSIFVTLFKTYGVFIDWKRLLFASSKYPCPQTPVLFPIILSHLNMRKEQVSALMYLVAIYQGQAVDKNKEFPLSNFKMFTVEDAKRVLKQQEEEINVKIHLDNVWSNAPENLDLPTLPIGAILNPVEDSSKFAYENAEEHHESFIINTTQVNATDSLMDVFDGKTTKENDTDSLIEDFEGRNGDSEEEMTYDEDDDSNFDLYGLRDTTIEDDMIYRREPKE